MIKIQVPWAILLQPEIFLTSTNVQSLHDAINHILSWAKVTNSDRQRTVSGKGLFYTFYFIVEARQG